MKTMDSAQTLLTTAEVAAYLRMKERTVYDMVARQQIPCSRATGKLLFSRGVIDAWVEAHTEMPAGRNAVVPQIYAGSSDPLLEWALRQSGSGLAVLASGSRRGLEAVARGEAVLAGVHLLDPGTGDYNIPQVRALVPQGDVVVIHWARRVQGLLVATGNPLGIASPWGCCRTGPASRATDRRGRQPAAAGGAAGSSGPLDGRDPGLGAGRRDRARSGQHDRDGRGRLRARRGGGGWRDSVSCRCGRRNPSISFCAGATFSSRPCRRC